MADDSSTLQSKCLFHGEGNCFLIESFPTQCTLCFNFVSAYPVAKAKSSLVNMFDYLKSEGKIKEIFPESQGTQTTL